MTSTTPSTRRSANWAAKAIALAGIVALSGCATAADDALTPEGSAAPEGSAEQLSLTVANMPIADQGSYFYALENGIFEEHNLAVTSAPATGGSAAIAAMVAGDFDVVYSGADGVIKAAANGVPVRIISGANVNQPEGEKDSTGLVVAPGIGQLSDLAGATIATNALGNINQVFAQEYLAQNGVDDVTVVEIPFPEQVAALESGTIKATLLPEPFASQAVAAGGSVLGFPYRIGEDQTTGVGVFVSTEQTIADKSEAVTAFVDAMEQAAEEANNSENRAAVVSAILANTKLESEVANNMTFVHWTRDVTPAQIQAVADLLTKYGSLTTDVDVQKIFATS